MNFISNKKKIENIINRYRDTDLKDTVELYTKVIFLECSEKNYIEVYTKKRIDDMDFIDIHNLDKVLHNLKHYKLFKISETGGYNFGFAKKDFFKGPVKYWDLISQNVIDGGGKFYIDIPFSKCTTLNREDTKEFYSKIDNLNVEDSFEFKGMELIKGYSPPLYNKSELADIIITNSDQILLTSNFIKDIFYELDSANFIDIIGFKYFPRGFKRKDRINFYLSSNMVNSDRISNRFAQLLKKLITRYQKKGLIFSVNNFIMPYRYDNRGRIIANTYIADSFNRSLIYFIVLYINPSMNLLRDFHYDNFTKNCNSREISSKDLEFVEKCRKELGFEQFVYNIFNYFEECDYQNYLKTYRELFLY